MGQKSIGQKKHNYQLDKNYYLKTRNIPIKPMFCVKNTKMYTPKSKDGSTGRTLLLVGVKITTFFNQHLQLLKNEKA